MTEAKLTAGEVEIELVGETRVLKPTIKACIDLSRKWGGFGALERALLARQLDAFVDVVAAGLGESDRGRVEQAVYETGLISPEGGGGDLLNRLVEYALVLQNGGRPLKEPDAGEAPARAEGA